MHIVPGMPMALEPHELAGPGTAEVARENAAWRHAGWYSIAGMLLCAACAWFAYVQAFNAGLLRYQFTGFDRLTMPVLVVVGGQDRAVGGQPMRDLAKRVPNGRLLELPKGGHFPYLEEPEAFARGVIRFVLP